MLKKIISQVYRENRDSIVVEAMGNMENPLSLIKEATMKLPQIIEPETAREKLTEQTIMYRLRRCEDSILELSRMIRNNRASVFIEKFLQASSEKKIAIIEKLAKSRNSNSLIVMNNIEKLISEKNLLFLEAVITQAKQALLSTIQKQALNIISKGESHNMTEIVKALTTLQMHPTKTAIFVLNSRMKLLQEKQKQKLENNQPDFLDKLNEGLESFKLDPLEMEMEILVEVLELCKNEANP